MKNIGVLFCPMGMGSLVSKIYLSFYSEHRKCGTNVRHDYEELNYAKELRKEVADNQSDTPYVIPDSKVGLEEVIVDNEALTKGQNRILFSEKSGSGQ